MIVGDHYADDGAPTQAGQGILPVSASAACARFV
jgi:hypothetical protein